MSSGFFGSSAPPAAVGVVVAKGEAEIGVHIIQELMPVARIDIVGPLPGDLQDTSVFSAKVITAKAWAVPPLLQRWRIAGNHPATPSHRR